MTTQDIPHFLLLSPTEDYKTFLHTELSPDLLQLCAIKIASSNIFVQWVPFPSTLRWGLIKMLIYCTYFLSTQRTTSKRKILRIVQIELTGLNSF